MTTPTRRPAGSAACSSGSSSRLEVQTGTVTAACSSRWNSARKPQLVEIAAQPSASSACAAATKGASSDRSASITTRLGDAPATTE